MSRKRTTFIAAERRLVITGLPKDHDPSGDILLSLRDAGIIEQEQLRGMWRGQTLSFVLKEHDDLRPLNLLARLARFLSKLPDHRVVCDPWEIGGKPVDIDLAVELIGNVFRSTTNGVTR